MAFSHVWTEFFQQPSEPPSLWNVWEGSGVEAGRLEEWPLWGGAFLCYIAGPCWLSIFFSFLLNLFIFNWRIIALQYYIGFYQISTWISHRFAYVTSHLKSLPPPSPSYPYRLLPSPGWFEFLESYACSHWLSILHMVMYVSMFLSPYLPPSPSSPSKERICFLFWI